MSVASFCAGAVLAAALSPSYIAHTAAFSRFFKLARVPSRASSVNSVAGSGGDGHGSDSASSKDKGGNGLGGLGPGVGSLLGQSPAEPLFIEAVVELASAPAEPAPSAASHAPRPRRDNVPPSVRQGLESGDAILCEMFTRNVAFFGPPGQARVAGAAVVVIGLGGVGSHAAHMLLRSGVGTLRLVDFDQVSLSSLNRHAVACRADVGTPKAMCLASHLARICPEATVEARVEMYSVETEAAILGPLGGRPAPNYVLDCIDDITTKVALLEACVRRGLPVLCSAGAGGRADPTRLCVADIAECSVDQLARSVRHRLKRAYGIERGIPVLFSLELPRCGLVPLELTGDQSPLDLQLVPHMRVRTMPVLGPLPAAFGMAMAAYALAALAGAPLTPAPPLRFRGEEVASLLSRLIESEELKGVGRDNVHVGLDEVHWLLRELWRGRSVRDDATEPAKGLWRPTAGLVLTRWDDARPAAPDNLVLLTFAEAEAHEATGVAAVRAAEPALATKVEALLRRAAFEYGLAPAESSARAAAS